MIWYDSPYYSASCDIQRAFQHFEYAHTNWDFIWVVLFLVRKQEVTSWKTLSQQISRYVHRYHNVLPFPLTFLKSLSSATVPWTTKEISKVVICSNKNYQCLKRQKLWTLGSTTKKWQLNKNIKLHFKMHYTTDTSIAFSVNQRR